jgi:hypothetical protein
MASSSGGTMALIMVLILLMVFGTMIAKSRANYSDNNPLLDQVRANFTKIDPKYAKIPLHEGDSAYTEDKQVITLCLVDPETKRNYDINTIMYVALHELGHVITPEGKEEHGPEFKENFSKLLKTGAKLGIYNPKKPIPASYCSVKAK